MKIIRLILILALYLYFMVHFSFVLADYIVIQIMPTNIDLLLIFVSLLTFLFLIIIEKIEEKKQ